LTVCNYTNCSYHINISVCCSFPQTLNQEVRTKQKSISTMICLKKEKCLHLHQQNTASLHDECQVGLLPPVLHAIHQVDIRSNSLEIVVSNTGKICRGRETWLLCKLFYLNLSILLYPLNSQSFHLQNGNNSKLSLEMFGKIINCLIYTLIYTNSEI
jgi:hypothetical protein